MNISAPFIQRPIATALLMVGLLVGGLVAYPLLPIAALPNVNYPTLQVTAQLPGADPQTMAASVATPLELQFGQIPGLTQMTSASALGFTQITLQFDLNRQIDGTVSDTLSAINAASPFLPPGIPYPPTIRKVNPADTPILVLGLTSDSLPLTTVDAYAENILLQKISQIPGRRPRRHRRPAKARRAGAARSAGACRARHQSRGRPHRARPGQCRPAERHAQQPAPDLYAEHQRPAAERGGLRQSRDRLPKRLAGPHPRRRPRRQRAGKRPDRRLVQQPARGHPGDPAPARRQRHRHRRADQGGDAGAAGLDPARRSRSMSSPTAPIRFAHPSTTFSSR